MQCFFSSTTAFRFVFSLLLVFVFIGAATAQSGEADTPIANDLSAAEWDTNSPYYKIMAENIAKLDTVFTPEILKQVGSVLERVTRVERDKALPHYYLAFIYANIAFQEKDLDKIDEWCDRSETAMVRSEKLGGVAQEEFLVIRALVQYGRLQVDFMGRGMEASTNAEKYLMQGYRMNPKHPRILAMLGQHYLRVPAQVGGSRSKACHYAGLAIEAFLAEEASRPADIFPIVPHWGGGDINEVVEKYCDAVATTPKKK